MELFQKETFEDYRATSYIENSGKSGNKSKKVKKTKKFQLLTYEELYLKDVLCLPAKETVSIFECYSSLDDLW